MMRQTNLSIIIPVYNTEKKLRLCVDSVLAQTYKEYEIILVNDGSTDNSSKICNDYSNLYDFVRYIEKPNGGIISARKAGVARAVGTYIMFLDSDDWVENEMFEYMMETIEKYNCDIVETGLIIESETRTSYSVSGFSKGLFIKDNFCKEIYPNMICNQKYFRFGLRPNLVCKLFRTELMKKLIVNIEEQVTMGEDAQLSYYYMANADSIYFSDKCFYHYVMNDSSVSHVYDAKQWVKTNTLINSMKRNIKNDKYNFQASINCYHMYMIERAIYRELLFNNANLIDRIKNVKKQLTSEIIKLTHIQKMYYVPCKKRILLFFIRHKMIYLLFLIYKLNKVKH